MLFNLEGDRLYKVLTRLVLLRDQDPKLATTTKMSESTLLLTIISTVLEIYWKFEIVFVSSDVKEKLRAILPINQVETFDLQYCNPNLSVLFFKLDAV